MAALMKQPPPLPFSSRGWLAGRRVQAYGLKFGLDSLLNGISEILTRIDIAPENGGDQFTPVCRRSDSAP